MLRFWHELPPREIALRLGESVHTVKTRLRRALAQLRSELDESCGDRAAWTTLLAPWLEAETIAPPTAAASTSTVLALLLPLLMKAKLFVAAIAVAALSIVAALYFRSGDSGGQDASPADTVAACRSNATPSCAARCTSPRC